MVVAPQTIGGFLKESEPVGALWPKLLDIVFAESPSEGRLERLSPTAQTLYLVVLFDGELVNGGFVQFFENSSGAYAAETLAALRIIGARRSAELLDSALTAFPGRVVPKEQRQRYELLDAFKLRQPRFFDNLDETYYREVDNLCGKPGEDIHELLVSFMRAHPEDAVAA